MDKVKCWELRKKDNKVLDKQLEELKTKYTNLRVTKVTGGVAPVAPKLSKIVLRDMLQNIPKGRPLETPLDPKQVRVLPAMVTNNPRYVDCGASSGTITPKTKRSAYIDCGASSGTITPKTKRPAFPPSSDRPLRDYKITNSLNYGSEEESDEEDELIAQPLMSREARMYMEEEDEVAEGSVKISRPSISASTPVSQTRMEPSDKFKFDWRAFPVPQIKPHLRREPFSQINSGPTVSFTNPYEAFIAIWDREIMELIVRETNLYAQQLTTIMLENGTICPQSRITKWKDTNVNELYTYLAIVLAMGMVIKSRLEEYWSVNKDIFDTPGFSMYMTSDRFHLLSKCLHFNNNINFNPELLTQSQAKLFKIKPIVDHLNCKFSKLYILSQNVAVDESLTMWKGLLGINQFKRNKAATVGIKTYEVCESKTGYLWRFEVHAGHDTSALQEDDDPVSGIIPSLVLRLLNGLEHKGHTIWMDNFYNSPALARELKIRGFDCAGTIRTNRKFVPFELANLSKWDMTVGEVVGCTSGDVDVMVWRDKICVGLISTYHGVSSTRCGETLKPTVVRDYNVCMGGVDRKDQQLSMYPIERKRTRVWYKKFFRRLLNASVLNAHILLGNQLLTHRQFRKALITDLLSAHGISTPTVLTSNTITTPHAPTLYDFTAAHKNRTARRCAVCKKRVSTYCKACNVTMCTFTCYELYHTSHD